MVSDTKFVYKTDPKEKSVATDASKEGSSKAERRVEKPSDRPIESVQEQKETSKKDVPRDMFLILLSFVWFCAFSSIYMQLDGLYGINGLAPIQVTLGTNKTSPHGAWDLVVKLASRPTVMWLAAFFKFDLMYCMKLLAGMGIVLSLWSIHKGGNGYVFFTMWISYLSLFNVGSVFMSFQWDVLLLEVGFMAIWLACPRGSDAFQGYLPRTTRYLLRYTLFKLMFMSGVVKLQSGCPSWFNLTALNYHFATQCLPTPLAWWASKLPAMVLKLGVWLTLVIEFPATLLLLSPVEAHRKMGMWLQISLQIGIMLTGNYNFFNLLTIALCITCCDGEWKTRRPSKTLTRVLVKTLKVLVGIAILAGGAWWTLPLSLDKSLVVANVSLDTTPERVLKQVRPLALAATALGLMYVLVGATLDFKSSSINVSGSRKIFRFAKKVLVFVGSLLFFTLSSTALLSVDHTLLSLIAPQYTLEMYRALSPFHLTSSYGLFRRMTGMGDGGKGQLVERPEIILFGSHDGMDWKEYDFRHKPGNITWIPTIVAPHQPRLDWQMWFAALGKAEDNPWFMNLVHHLLHGSADVRELMSPESPFMDAPPRFIKADLYKYDFTERGSRDWWSRQFSGKYLAKVEADAPSLHNYLRTHGLPTTIHKKDKTHSHADDLRETIIFTCAFIAFYEVLKRSFDLVRSPKGKDSSQGKDKID